MDRIRVKHSHPHGRPLDEARAGVDRLIAALRARFPAYDIQARWEDEQRRRLAFTFAKEGRSSGTGSAVLVDGRVDVELDARYKLPFLVPVPFAEALVRQEIVKALEQAFG